MHTADISFSFGRNWRDFLDRSIDEVQMRSAQERTRELLRVRNLDGLTFLDVGCGSGLFSRVAHSLGAARIVSFDVDPLSVECCLRMRSEAGNPANWNVLHGSILDDSFVRTLPRADVVYSWGVLHHTGDMWRAIRNAADLVRPGGRFAIAIYNKVEYDTLRSWRGSYWWLRMKRAYNRGGPATKRAMEWTLASKSVAGMLLRLHSPMREIRDYKHRRGMSWRYDMIDWLGGYPYEFASAGEIFSFCHDELGMQLGRLRTAHATGCHEFLFVAPAAAAMRPTLVTETAHSSLV